MKLKEIQLLLEAQNPEQVYQRYYSDIDREAFSQIVKADTVDSRVDDDGNIKKVGAGAKWLLKIYREKNLNLEDLYKFADNYKLFKRVKGKLDDYARDLMHYKSLGSLARILDEFKKSSDSDPEKMTKKQRNEAIEVAYENSEWIVYHPTTYEATNKLGKNPDGTPTEWCTNIKSYYETYTDNNSSQKGLIFVIINKKNEWNRYQLHLETGQLMDRFDDPVGQYMDDEDDEQGAWYSDIIFEIAKKYDKKFKDPVVYRNMLDFGVPDHWISRVSDYADLLVRFGESYMMLNVDSVQEQKDASIELFFKLLLNERTADYNGYGPVSSMTKFGSNDLYTLLITEKDYLKQIEKILPKLSIGLLSLLFNRFVNLMNIHYVIQKGKLNEFIEFIKKYSEVAGVARIKNPTYFISILINAVATSELVPPSEKMKYADLLTEYWPDASINCYAALFRAASGAHLIENHEEEYEKLFIGLLNKSIEKSKNDDSEIKSYYGFHLGGGLGTAILDSLHFLKRKSLIEKIFSILASSTQSGREYEFSETAIYFIIRFLQEVDFYNGLNMVENIISVAPSSSVGEILLHISALHYAWEGIASDQIENSLAFFYRLNQTYNQKDQFDGSSQLFANNIANIIGYLGQRIVRYDFVFTDSTRNVVINWCNYINKIAKPDAAAMDFFESSFEDIKLNHWMAPTLFELYKTVFQTLNGSYEKQITEIFLRIIRHVTIDDNERLGKVEKELSQFFSYAAKINGNILTIAMSKSKHFAPKLEEMMLKASIAKERNSNAAIAIAGDLMRTFNYSTMYHQTPEAEGDETK